MRKLKTWILFVTFAFLFVGCASTHFTKESSFNQPSNLTDITISVKENSITDTSLVLLIKNNTSNEYSYDMSYYIEQKRNDEWFAEKDDRVFNALAAILKPNATDEFHVTWEKKLPKGTYRVIKPVVAQTAGVTSVEFTVD